jgi:hypothetical protein
MGSIGQLSQFKGNIDAPKSSSFPFYPWGFVNYVVAPRDVTFRSSTSDLWIVFDHGAVPLIQARRVCHHQKETQDCSFAPLLALLFSAQFLQPFVDDFLQLGV